jgi:hypothetical protein
LIVLAAGLVIFAAYYPFAVYLHRDYVRRPVPSGKVVEFIPRFEETHGGAYQALIFTNNVYHKAMLYEDLTLLQEVDIVTLPTRPPSWRFFNLPRRDGPIQTQKAGATIWCRLRTPSPRNYCPRTHPSDSREDDVVGDDGGLEFMRPSFCAESN